MSLEVGIVGSGTAGQAAAIMLSRQGHAVTVFEQSPSLGPVGAGLLLQPTGVAVLARLGAADTLTDLAAPIHRLHGSTARGRSVLDVSYADLRPGLVGLGLQRAAISAVLHDAMTDAGATLRLGASIRHAAAEAGFIVEENGAEHGPFDLIVVADGSRSRVRAGFPHLVRRDRPYTWGALWALCDEPDDRYADVLRQVYRGTSTMLGFLPSGRASADAPKRISLFWSVRASGHGGVLDLDAWKATIRALTDEADPLLEQITSAERLIFAPYRDAVMRRPHDGRVVFIGDAWHSMSPQLGQGVNLALLDAAALADSIESSGSVHDALLRFQRVRRRSVAFYQRASRWLTPVFQSSLDPLAWPRDLCMGPLCRFPPFRRRALLSLAGVKTGIFTSDRIPNR